MEKQNETYEVLARKYRPTSFSNLAGQEVLVKTLTNAIKTERISHAYIFTGIRGTGKTSTARLLAKSLNCIGKDNENKKATTEPCGVCEHCKAISESRHVDVYEIDAASHTGVDDMREILENIQYRPTSARYKIYIIDEVHMLSKSAFNALLKTLEEPPAHVKFFFATTEIRKVPPTILSRCQRFNLSRIDTEKLKEHIKYIAEKENAVIDDEAALIIAKAAEGSARDAVSILDQAISNTNGDVKSDAVASMLGLSDQSINFDLFEHIAFGRIQEALDLITKQHNLGSEPALIIKDLLNINYWITRLKIHPESLEVTPFASGDLEKLKKLSQEFSIPDLSKIYQMLLKSLSEIQISPNPNIAFEMAIIRITHSAALPNIDELIKLVKNDKISLNTSENSEDKKKITPNNINTSNANLQKHNSEEKETATNNTLKIPTNIHELAKILREKKEIMLALFVENSLSVVNFEPNQITINLKDNAKKDDILKLKAFLKTYTGKEWIIAMSEQQGEATINEEKDRKFNHEKEKIQKNPLISHILKTFPDSKVENIE